MLPKTGSQKLVYEYDFSVDGGAVSAITLRPKISNVKLDATMVVKKASIHVKTALTSGGSATCVIGPVKDADGYFADIFALGVINTVVEVGQVDGALLWNTTTDSNISDKITGTNDLLPKLTIGTAALTAGKFDLLLEVEAF